MNLKLTLAIIGIGLSISLSSLKLAIAETTTSPPVTTPSATVKAETIEQTLSKIPGLETAIGNYIKAWQEQDFKTMRGYESWEGGEELNEIKYIQTFDADFKLATWQITKVQPLADNQYKVLVLVTHNPSKQVAAFVPINTKVRSTLVQWWKKEGEKFIHLFNIERKILLQSGSPVLDKTFNPFSPPKSPASPPSTTDDRKKDDNAKPAEKTKAE